MCDFTGSGLLKQVCWREAGWQKEGAGKRGPDSVNCFQVLVPQAAPRESSGLLGECHCGVGV